jgi:hypothetical protein
MIPLCILSILFIPSKKSSRENNIFNGCSADISDARRRFLSIRGSNFSSQNWKDFHRQLGGGRLCCVTRF